MEQWKITCLLMQGRGLGSPAQEDSTRCRPAKPIHHSYWASSLQPRNPNSWAHILQLLTSDCPESVLCDKGSQHSEKPSTAVTSSPHSPQLEKVLAAVKTQHNQTLKKKILDSKGKVVQLLRVHSRVEKTRGITGSFPCPLSLQLTDKHHSWAPPWVWETILREGGWVLLGRYRAWARVNPGWGGETFRMLQGGKQEEGREGRSSDTCWMLLGCAFCWRLDQC